MSSTIAAIAATAQTVTISIKLMSGDILSIQVDPSQPASILPIQFIRQYHYAPSAIDRLVFIHLDESHSDESHMDESQSETVWYPSERDTPLSQLLMSSHTVLNLFIKPLEEPDYKKYQKMELVRDILLKGKRYEHYSMEDIYSMYSTWVLTYIPKNKTNRYIQMATFVNDHPEKFYPLSPEQLVERERRIEQLSLHNDVAEFRIFRSKGEALPPLCPHQFGWFIDECRIIGEEQRRLSPESADVILRYVSVPRLFEMGLTHLNFPINYRYNKFIANWDTLSAVSLQMEKEPHIVW